MANSYDLDSKKEEAQSAYSEFEEKVDEIKEVREADIGVLEEQVNEIELNTWVEAIQLWAEDMTIDGFTVNQLYPDCVNELQG